MSNKKVKKKRLDASNHVRGSWLLLAEDAERGAIKAQERSKQLTEAAKIFRKNAEREVQFQQSTDHALTQQHSV